MKKLEEDHIVEESSQLSLEDFPRSLELLQRVERAYDDPSVEVSDYEATELIRFFCLSCERYYVLQNEEFVSRAEMNQEYDKIPNTKANDNLEKLIEVWKSLSEISEAARPAAKALYDRIKAYEGLGSYMSPPPLIAHPKWNDLPCAYAPTYNNKNEWVLDSELKAMNVFREQFKNGSLQDKIELLGKILIPFTKRMLATKDGKFKVFESLKRVIESADGIPPNPEAFIRSLKIVFEKLSVLVVNTPEKLDFEAIYAKYKRPTELELSNEFELLLSGVDGLKKVLDKASLVLKDENDIVVVKQSIESVRAGFDKVMKSMEKHMEDRNIAGEFEKTSE